MNTMTMTTQFNFARRWKKDIRPMLDDPDVLGCLTLGMTLLDPSYQQGDPPWLLGRGPLNGQRARNGCLSWYQPWGRCHYIAPFSWALGMRLFPQMRWSFLSGELHTVVIGFEESPEVPEWVFDILLFKDHSADESLTFVKSRTWALYDSLPDYIASFCDCEQAKRELRQSEVLNGLCRNTANTSL